MIQEIITYIIITITTAYTLYSFVKVFIPSKNKTVHSCCSGCSGCDLKNSTKLQKISVKSLY